MKKYTILVLLYLICTLGYGQFTKKKSKQTKDRTGQKAENRLDRRLDNGIDKGLDKMENLLRFGKKKKKKEKADQQEPVAQNGASQGASTKQNSSTYTGHTSSPGQHRQQYQFHEAYNGKMKTTDKKGKTETIFYTYYINHNEDYIGMKVMPAEGGQETSIMIFDYANNSTVMLVNSTEGKMGMVMPVNNGQQDVGEIETGSLDASFIKTGKKVEKMGYMCQEYKYDHEGFKGSVWVTDEISMKTSGMNNALQNTPQAGNSPIPLGGFPYGFVIASSAEATDGSRFDMSIQDVTTYGQSQPWIVDTADYQMMSGLGR
ncbi:MAG: DUF4412 domain-containing protein [Bacteroidota bacterium]